VTYRLLALAEQLDRSTIRQVFTHTSWAADRVASYERFEFLGDSVLSLCITTELYRRFPSHTEGHLARLRAYIVSRATCARVATRLGLGRMMREHAVSTADAGEAAQLQANQNVLADLTEALIGACYVTFGFEAVRPAVIEVFEEHIRYAESSYIDHKTELQEHLARTAQAVQYRVLGFSGPPHDREFEIEAVVDGEPLGRGFGTSKKRAEQEAAAEALHELTQRARRSTRRARLRGRRARRPGEDGGDGEGAGGASGGPSGPDAPAAPDLHLAETVDAQPGGGAEAPPAGGDEPPARPARGARAPRRRPRGGTQGGPPRGGAPGKGA
jgi:ribonuclease-3